MAMKDFCHHENMLYTILDLENLFMQVGWKSFCT